MKIKLSKKQIEAILADAYICGLILAGAGTTSCSHFVGII